MSYPSEYIDPLPRVSNVQCTMSSGYAGARVSREDPLFFPGSGDGDEHQVYLQNVGATAYTVQIKQTDDYSFPGSDSVGTPTGTRFDVGTATALVPGGTSTLQVSPWMPYLEFWCTTGSGPLRAQIVGRTRWQRMAFDKTEADTTASGTPANGVADGKLWNIKPIPSASTSVP
jgi:hypothetical protein